METGRIKKVQLENSTPEEEILYHWLLCERGIKNFASTAYEGTIVQKSFLYWVDRVV